MPLFLETLTSGGRFSCRRVFQFENFLIWLMIGIGGSWAFADTNRDCAIVYEAANVSIFTVFRRGELLPGYSNRTQEALRSLTSHLSLQQKSRLETVLAQIAKNAGDKTFDSKHRGHEGAGQRVLNALYAIAKAHNEWVDVEPKSRERFRISIDELPTANGLQAAVWALQRKDVKTQTEVNQIALEFGDLTNGAVLAFRDKTLLPAYPTNTIQAFETLIAHLPKEDRQSLAEMMKSDLNPRSGEKSYDSKHKSQPYEARAVLRVLAEVIRCHNQWVKSSSQNGSDEILLQDLRTSDGLRKAIWKLQQKNVTNEEVTQRLAGDFCEVTGGGISAFKRGALLPGYSSDAGRALLSLTSHLGSPAQSDLASLISQQFSDITGRRSLESHLNQPTAARKILRVLIEIIDKHNAWVAQEVSRNQLFIDVDQLKTPSGVKRVINRLKTAAP